MCSCPEAWSTMHKDPLLAGNGILAKLGPDDLDLLRPDLLRLDLPVRHRMATPDVVIEHAYFLSSGIASYVTHVKHDIPIEIGIVGREGFMSPPLVLGVDRSPEMTYMQAAGHGHRIGSGELRAAMDRSPSLTRILQLYVHVFMTQTASTVLANGRASLAQRLARWLLMADDRIDGSVLPLTHEFLSVMLGVRRSGVTTALRELEHRGLITRNRGNIVLVDREGVIEQADGYYGSAERELHRLFGPSGT